MCTVSPRLPRSSYFGLPVLVRQLYQHLTVVMANLFPIASGPTLAFARLLNKPDPPMTIGGPKSESFTQKSSVLHFVDSVHLECSPHIVAFCMWSSG